MDLNGMVKDFTEEDLIIVLVGTKDLHHNEPAQLTVSQGTRSLFSLKQNTNILVNNVPYRWQKNWTLFHEDINSILTRAHFTKHGPHYNQHGKELIADFF